MLWTKIKRVIRTTAAWTKTSRTARAIRTWAEYLGKLAVVAGVLSFIVEAPERAKQRHYQAWQLIDAARQLPGDAGRRIALRDLINDHVEMRGIDLSDASIEGFDFRSANMPFANFFRTKLKEANFSCQAGLYISEYWLPSFKLCWRTVLDDASLRTEMDGIDFSHALMRRAKLGWAPTEDQGAAWKNGDRIPIPDLMVAIWNSKFANADMDNAFFSNAMVSRNVFTKANMAHSVFFHVNLNDTNSFVGADLREADFLGMSFIKKVGEGVSDFTDANLTGARFDNHDLTANDLPPHATHLCRTKLTSGLVNRDCPQT